MNQDHKFFIDVFFIGASILIVAFSIFRCYLVDRACRKREFDFEQLTDAMSKNDEEKVQSILNKYSEDNKFKKFAQLAQLRWGPRY